MDLWIWQVKQIYIDTLQNQKGKKLFFFAKKNQEKSEKQKSDRISQSVQDRLSLFVSLNTSF